MWFALLQHVTEKGQYASNGGFKDVVANYYGDIYVR